MKLTAETIFTIILMILLITFCILAVKLYIASKILITITNLTYNNTLTNLTSLPPAFLQPLAWIMSTLLNIEILIIGMNSLILVGLLYYLLYVKTRR